MGGIAFQIVLTNFDYLLSLPAICICSQYTYHFVASSSSSFSSFTLVLVEFFFTLIFSNE